MTALYWLESGHKLYADADIYTLSSLDEALTEYHETIKGMMKALPESEWFDLKLWRQRTPDDPVAGNTKSTKNIIVRSWVY